MMLNFLTWRGSCQAPSRMRQWAVKFMRGLHLILQPAMSMFHCATLEEELARPMEGKAAHRIHHMRRSQGSLLSRNRGKGTREKIRISREHHKGVRLMMSWLFMQYRLSRHSTRLGSSKCNSIRVVSSMVVKTTQCTPPTRGGIQVIA